MTDEEFEIFLAFLGGADTHAPLEDVEGLQALVIACMELLQNLRADAS
jgi:hypothetical protein